MKDLRHLRPDLDPAIRGLLQQLGLSEGAAPNPEAWLRLLAALSQHYQHVREQESVTIESLQLSNQEMLQQYSTLQQERDRLLDLVAAIREALDLFEELSSDPEDSQAAQVGPRLDRAKLSFSSRVGGILAGVPMGEVESE